MNNLSASLSYNPISYERYLAPLQAYNAALQSQEDMLTELGVKANVWEGLANQQTDKRAYAQFKKYADDLSTQAQALAEKGLYEGSRRALMDLKNRYSKEITPIENAYTTRKQQAELQQKARAAHPDMLYGRDAATTSLDTYLANPQYDALAQQYSGQQLTKNVEDAASALAKEAHANPAIRKSLQQVLPYQYYAKLERTGFKSEDVYNAIHSANGSPILKQIVNDAMKASGIQDWDNYEAIKDQALSYANQGLWKAVGTTKFDKFTDEYGMQMALLNRKLAAEAAAAQQQQYTTSLPMDSTNVTFGATDPGTAERNFKHSSNILGITYKNGRVLTSKVNVTGAVKAPDSNGRLVTTYAAAQSKDGTNTFRLFTPKGKIVTEAQFVAQGKDATSQKLLREYYRNAKKQMGGSSWAQGAYSKMKQRLDVSGATQIELPNLDFEDNTKVFKGKVGNLVDNIGGAYTVTAGLKDYSKGKRVSAADIQSMVDDGANITYNVSFDKNNPGMVISVGRERFFVPAANMSSAARQGFTRHTQKMAQIEQYAKQLAEQKKAAEAQYGQQYADEMYAPYEAQLENASVNIKAEAIENIGWGVDGSYNSPKAKLFTQKNN